MRSRLVYGLIDPRSLLIRYIGLSTTGMRRPRTHRSPSRMTGSTHRAAWLRELHRAGLTFEIVVLEQAADLEAAEQWWIAYGRALGWPLTNSTDGGDGMHGHVKSPETRRKIATANRGQTRTPEAKARMSAARIQVLSDRPELAGRLGELAKSRPVTAETRAKLSELSRRRSPESFAKIGAANRLRVVSDETRRKMSESHRRAWTARKARRGPQEPNSAPD